MGILIDSGLTYTLFSIPEFACMLSKSNGAFITSAIVLRDPLTLFIRLLSTNSLADVTRCVCNLTGDRHRRDHLQVVN